MDDLILYQVSDALVLGEQHLHTIFPCCDGGVLSPFSNPVVCNDRQYRMTPNGALLQFFVIYGQSLSGDLDEGDTCFFPSTIGMLFMAIAVNELWGCVLFGAVVTWYRKDGNTGFFVPFCSEFLGEK